MPQWCTSGLSIGGGAYVTIGQTTVCISLTFRGRLIARLRHFDFPDTFPRQSESRFYFFVTDSVRVEPCSEVTGDRPIIHSDSHCCSIVADFHDFSLRRRIDPRFRFTSCPV